VTIGGYNAAYTPPAHYPQTVPRLGLNWAVSNELTINGDLYFALTPGFVMAGDLLKAAYQSGNLSAWFTAQADFLCQFGPFTYSADITVSIGVSYTLHFVTTKTISAQVGVGLQLFGPPFGGTATIDLDVVSATIRFGAASGTAPPPIPTWALFRQEFLPAPNASQPQSVITNGQPETQTASLIAINAPNCILSTNVDGVDWVVNPLTFSLVIATVTPNTQMTLDIGTATPPPFTAATLGIAPMALATGKLTVTLAITVEINGQVDQSLQWQVVPTFGPVPAALWGGGAPTLSSPSLIAGALTGVTLVPVSAPPDQTMPVTFSLLASDDLNQMPVATAWSSAAPPSSDDFATVYAGTAAASVIGNTINAAATSATRLTVLEELALAGFATLSSVDLSAFATAAPTAFAAEPQLRLLGETA